MTPKPSNPSYPPHVLATLEEVEMLKINGEHEKSIALAQKLLVEDPDCVGALEEIADNYVSMEQHDRAEKAANRALQLDRNSYTAYYILGFLASNQQKWEVALEFLKRANVLHPNNAEILRCLGWCTFNSNKRAQGIVILERALNLDPEQVFKTLLADVDGSLVVGIVPVTGRLDLKALAAAVGGKKAEMADPKVAERRTGYVVGGISPFGQRTALPTVLDDSALDFDTILVSGGRRGFDIEIAPADLLAVTRGTAARIRRL